MPHPLRSTVPAKAAALVLFVGAGGGARAAFAACPSGYNNGCNAGAGVNMCTAVSLYEISCDLGAHAGSGNTEAWVVSPSSGHVQIWGTDESANGWCCEYDTNDCQTVLTVTGTPQIDTVDLNHGTYHAKVSTWAYGGSGADYLTASYDASCASHLYGENDGDYLTGFDGVDYIYGGGGSDTINGGGGADYLYGDADTDYINGQDGDDYIEAGAGGNDWVKGGAGDDLIIGGAGNDILCGGDGNDEIHGNAPAGWTDWLYGMMGVDDLYGDGASTDTRCETTADGGVRSGCNSTTLTGCAW